MTEQVPSERLLWIPLAERLPADDEPKFLVTNHLEARNAHGHRSHVWLVMMVHEHEPGDKTIHNRDAYQEFGRFSAFDDYDGRIRGLTHWASLREYLV